MTDTAFWAPAGGAGERLAAAYMGNPSGAHLPAVAIDGSSAWQPPPMWSGGGGLVGTAGDYHRFALMLRGGGQLEGVRLLSPRTVAYMTRNQLPGGADLERFGRRLFAETTFDGVGFGLGFSVVTDPAAGKVLCGPGEFGWGGAFSTAFWVAPEEDLTALFFTQLLPSSTLSDPVAAEATDLPGGGGLNGRRRGRGWPDAGGPGWPDAGGGRGWPDAGGAGGGQTGSAGPEPRRLCG